MLVENILRHPEGNCWQVQGLGMLRCYLDEAKRYRLHIWDNALRVPGVSAMHNHPWNLKSTVIAGCYKQYRFTDPLGAQFSEGYNMVTIKCGSEACVVSEPQKVRLSQSFMEVYITGSEYTQNADEIHVSVPDDGTVTLVERVVPDGGDPTTLACIGAAKALG
jgi:hypothetical protein